MSDTSPLTAERNTGCCGRYADAIVYGIFRKKSLSANRENVFKTNLRRCLNLGELIAVGLASMLGGSIYVLTGAVMLKHTGPSVFLGYLGAGIVAMLNAIVYSELATRIPRSGSSYSYAYILLGELLGFLTGWSILLEYILSVCTVARGWSSMLDGLTGRRISTWIIENFGRLSSKGDILAEYPDFIGAILIVIMATISCCGVRGGARVTGFFIVINMLALLVISIFMAIYAQPANLRIDVPPTITDQDPNTVDKKFLPFGIGGLIGGIAICFNAFIGFDAISTCAEETKDPSRDLPKANVIAVLVVTTITVFASLTLVMYYPWYLASPEIPFLSVLRDNGNGGSEAVRLGMFYFVGCGCLVGLTSSLLSNLVAGPRIAYAIAGDGLLSTCFSHVCQPFKTPVIATAFFTVLTIALEMIFSVVSLADFLSLGTLIAYSMGSIGVLMLRYGTPPEERNKRGGGTTEQELSDLDYVTRTNQPGYLKQSWTKCMSLKCVRALNMGPPGSAVTWIIAVYVMLNTVLIVLLRTGAPQNIWPIWRLVLFPIIFLLMIMCIVFISAFAQHKPPHRDLFRLPLVPFLPCATITVNMFLISELSWVTWVRFSIWLAIGILIYFFYGVCHSVAAKEENVSWSYREMMGFKKKEDSPDE